MKYKVGDKVKVKSDLNEVTDVVKDMMEFEGKLVTISELNNETYKIEDDKCKWFWTDDMFESGETKDEVEETTENKIEEEKVVTGMKLEDIKVGMKVKLLGKHIYDDYDNIEDFYDDNSGDCCVEFFVKNDYGIVDDIGIGEEVCVSCGCGIGFVFLPSDLALFEEEVEVTIEKEVVVETETLTKPQPKLLSEATIEELQARIIELQNEEEQEVIDKVAQINKLLDEIEESRFIRNVYYGTKINDRYLYER